ncbi:MAG: 16S rRNA (guanine(966)-N(2))-methyltransferase RsmD [Chloroflexi bacterium]|nr:16S rRNA (guanine(966)-N(2))-methyltransferase RsmD [Chloroflexota bacterium]
MRVIAGTAKGRTLKSPPESTRPITDRVKENLFNILGTDVIDANVLDLFAGAGSVGIEALSRGAKHATFVEFNDDALKTIRANLTLTKLIGKATVVRENVYRFLKKPPAVPHEHSGSPSSAHVSTPYDLIYVAPPQYKEMWKETLKLLDARPQWLSENGILVVQIHPVEFEELELKSFVLDDERKYGSTLLCFYVKQK